MYAISLTKYLIITMRQSLRWLQCRVRQLLRIHYPIMESCSSMYC